MSKNEWWGFAAVIVAAVVAIVVIVAFDRMANNRQAKFYSDMRQGLLEAVAKPAAPAPAETKILGWMGNPVLRLDNDTQFCADKITLGLRNDGVVVWMEAGRK